MRLSWARILSLPLALMTVLSAGPAMAAGGANAYTRLLVGARPLGMGGAFTGLADDVTATFYNPAGISALQQREVTAMHAALSFDRDYNFIAGAFPNHKGDSAWGFSYTRFSIDGIPETRLADAVNPVTNSDGTVTIFSLFDDVEDNVAVQYGWKINDQLRLGAAARLNHRELFEREANGFGMDFGALYQATNDVRIGMSLRHIFEGIRENFNNHRDDVPFVATAGVAVRGWKDAMYVLDIFFEEEDGAGVRAGIEKWWNDHYAARIGYNDGEFSAGASAKYQKFQFDYAFQTQDLGDINRVSLIYRF